MTTAVFVAGTDTGVGKTVITAALACYLRRAGFNPGVMKPLETGVASPASPQSDAVRLTDAAGVTDELTLVRPYAFSRPVAPLYAARLAGRRISLPHIARALRILSSRHPVMLIEGVGGVRVPVTRHADVIDLVASLKLPTVVVGRAGLGGINHACLTIEALQRRKMTVVALVLNESHRAVGAEARHQRASTVALLRERLTMPVIGPLPYVPSLEARWSSRLNGLSRSAAIRTLARLVVPRA